MRDISSRLAWLFSFVGTREAADPWVDVRARRTNRRREHRLMDRRPRGEDPSVRRDARHDVHPRLRAAAREPAEQRPVLLPRASRRVEPVGGNDASEVFGGSGNDIIDIGKAATEAFGGAGDDWMEGSDSPASVLVGDENNQFQNDVNGGHDVFLATTYDGANLRLYVNGVLAGTRRQTGGITVGDGPLRIGGNNAFQDVAGVFGGEFFQGLIDEVPMIHSSGL